MKILVVDDHVLIREALRGVLRELDGAATILEASGGAAAMHLIEGHGDLGLVLLDLTLPDCDGFSLLAGIREYHPGVSIVVMSALQDRATVTRALDLGALGFIPKSAQREVMLSALRLIFSGGVYIPPQILVREEPTTKHSQGPDRRARRSRGLILAEPGAGFCLRTTSWTPTGANCIAVAPQCGSSRRSLIYWNTCSATASTWSARMICSRPSGVDALSRNRR